MKTEAKFREQAKARDKYEYVHDPSIPCWETLQHYHERHSHAPDSRRAHRWHGFGKPCKVIEKCEVGSYTTLVFVRVDDKEFWVYSTDLDLSDG